MSGGEEGWAEEEWDEDWEYAEEEWDYAEDTLEDWCADCTVMERTTIEQ